MADTPIAPKKMTLSQDLLQVLTAGDAARLMELLSLDGQTNGHVAINVAAPQPPGPGTSSCLLGVTSNGNTALHLVASRGHAELVTLICEKAPSLVATRNSGLDTPLHCAARRGHREAVTFLVSTMLHAGVEEAVAALRATNCRGDTALHEAVRHRRAEVVDLLMAEAPDLASVTSDDGVSALYLAATTESVQLVQLLLRPSPDGTASPASFAGREGRTALHVAATCSREMVENILAWDPKSPALLTTVDSSGRSPLHFAVESHNIDVVKLFLDIDSHIARIPDNKGLFPLHYAAAWGSLDMIDELIKTCPDYHELVDQDGMNLLHFAVESGNNTAVSYICQYDRFNILWNATDFQGNTVLHLAVKNSCARIVCTLLHTPSVEININSKGGLTPIDIAYIAYKASSSRYFLDPACMVINCLHWVGAQHSFYIRDIVEKDKESSKEEKCVEGYMKGNGTIASALIATVTFTAAVTVPGGFIADDHSHPGIAILAKRFAFRAFAASNALAFLCSIVATCYFIYGGAREVPSSHRWSYNAPASGLLPVAVQFMTAAFAFTFHLVLGSANHGLIIFVYFVSSVAVLFCFPGIWVPFFLGYAKVLWRRGGWMGFLLQVKRILFAVLICATFIVAIVLEIALPDY